MRKNLAGQSIDFEMISIANGSGVTTGTPVVNYKLDGGVYAVGSGAIFHDGGGSWEYLPTQLETNGDKATYQMVLTGAVTQVINVWPVAFDPSDATALGLANLDAAVSSRNATTPPTEAAIRAEIDSNSTQLAALISRLTVTRAAYLDKLNITGNVAASGEVTAIQNNTRIRLIVPQLMERPDSGSTAFKLHVWIYDAVGNMEAPDSLPSLTAVNQTGTSRSSNLGTVTLESTGHYSVTYTLASTDSIEQLIFEWSIVEGGITRLHGVNTQVVDTTAVDFTSADRTKLDTLHDTRLTAARAGYLDTLNSGVPLSAASIDSFFEELTAGHSTAGTYGKLLTDILQDTSVDIPALITALNDLSAAQVNAEILDALTVDTYAELAAIPASTTSIVKMLQLLFMMSRNLMTQTDSTKSLFANDGVTLVGSSPVSDDGTTYTDGKMS